MKLNTGKAWEEASRMIGANRELVLVVAGIFLFVPMFVLFQVLFAFDWNLGDNPTEEMIAEQIGAFFQQNWWALLLAMLGQLCGTIALLGLLGDPGKPTVSEVLRSIPKLILPAFGAQILVTLVTQGPSLLTELLPPVAAGLASIVLLPITIYLAIKLTLTYAAIVIDGIRNPVSAMRQSWRLTKGNSLRIFGFVFAIAIVAIVLGIVVFIVLGLALAMAGARIQMIGLAIIMAMIVAAYGAVSVAVTAAIHRQLSSDFLDFDDDPAFDE